MSSFSIYLIGTLVIIGALSWGAYLIGAPPEWIGIGATLVLGIGLISGATSTRKKDETEASE